MTTLDNIKPGQGGIIRAVGGQGALRRRLLDMGLTPRTNVHVNKELNLRGYVLTLRLEDAAKIEVDTEGAK